MSFFVWLRLDAYKPYIALYMAGKILAVVAAFSWLIFSLPLIPGIQGTDTLIGTVLLLSFGDILTVLGGAVLKRRIRGGKTRKRKLPVSEEGKQCV
jgi:hypothetical protein